MSLETLTDYLASNGSIQKKTAIYYLKHMEFLYSEAETNFLTGIYQPILATNYEKCIETIKKLTTSRQWNPGSVLNYYKSLVKICTVFRNYYGEINVSQFDKALEEYNKMYIPLNNEKDEIRKSNKKTEKQSENWKEWSEIVKDRDAQYEIIKDYTSDNNKTYEYTEVLKYVFACIYTLVPPRRVLDYQFMRVVSDMDGCVENDCNYYVQSKRLFVFNVYKMAKKQQTVKVPKKLCNILDWYIYNFHPYYKQKDVIDYGTHYLFLNHLGKQTHAATFSSCLYSVFKKKISINMLRHIYITCNLGEHIEKAKEAADFMSHSSAIQMQYIVH